MTNFHLPGRRIMLAIALFVSLTAAQIGHAEPNIGTVDVNRILKEYRKSKDAEAKMIEARNAAKKEFDERVDGYKKELEEINKINAQIEAPAMAAEAKAQKAKQRDEKIATLKNMEREIDEFRQTREQQLQQQARHLQENLLSEITAVVSEQAKAKNLDLVFDTSGASLNRISPVLFSKERADFTGDVLAVLNKAPITSATSPAAKP